MINIDAIFTEITEITRLVIKSMTSVEIIEGKTYRSEDNPIVGDMSATIGITGETKITLTLSLKKEAATMIYYKLFQGEGTEPEMNHLGDMVGEITNVVAGRYKNYLSKQGMKFESTIPIIILGQQRLYHPTGCITRAIPFYIEDSHMYIEISVRSE
jgi:CheY-specific phosphatase CheX